MDRFIGGSITLPKQIRAALKSNMDRFIGPLSSSTIAENGFFKIQYG